MDKKEVETEIHNLTGINPGTMFIDDSHLSYTTSKNPPEDILTDGYGARIAIHYIIDRISRDEVVERVHKIWPEANGLDFSAFMDKLDKEKEEYWRKVRGETKVGT